MVRGDSAHGCGFAYGLDFGLGLGLGFELDLARFFKAEPGACQFSFHSSIISSVERFISAMKALMCFLK